MRRSVVVRRGGGVVGTMARTAVVAGTATAVSRGVSRSMDQGSSVEAQAQAAQAQELQTAAQQQDLAAQLEKLADMKAKGVLTDQEYQVAKKKLLG